MDSQVLLADYGRRLIPQLIDERAGHGYLQPFTSIPRSLIAEDGFLDISYFQFANAVNRCAWWIQDILGKGYHSNAIAYTGPSDIRYGILTIAALKAGYKLFVPSPRLSVEDHVSLLELIKCKIYLTPYIIPVVVKDVLSKRSMSHFPVPDLKNWLDDSRVPLYPFEGTFEDTRNKTFVVSHSSGSTGIPKLIEVTHGTFAAQDHFQTLPSQGLPPTILESFKGIRMHLGLPLFHAAAYFCFFSAATYYSMTSVVTPAVPMTAEVADAVHTYGNVQASCQAPSIYIEMTKKPHLLDKLKGMKFIMYGGGPLAKEAGDIIKRVINTPILSLLGTTETMLLPLEMPDRDEWEYHRFSRCLGAEFRPQWEDLCELVIVRDPELDLSQAVFATFPELQEFPMQDLYSEHPVKKGLWRYRGRLDDVVTLVNGEKFNPLMTEGTIGNHAEVESVLVFGAGHFHAGLLIEAKEHTLSEEERIKLLERIWPYIERANQVCPAHARILRGMTIFTTREKPMKRAAKGTVQRRSTIDLYQKEIDALYASTLTVDSADLHSVALIDHASIKSSLRKFISENLKIENVEFETNLFSLGLDSLQVLEITRQVNSAAEKQGFYMMPETVYANPTVSELASKIISLKEGSRSAAHGQGDAITAI